MKHFKCAPTLAAALGMAAGIPTPAHAFPAGRRLAPPAFLTYRVVTVADLASEVSSDAVVRARLARHFHLSGAALCAFVRHDLSQETLASPCPARVFNLGAGAQEYAVESRLLAGTPVFVARSTGRPVLLAAGGNPIIPLGGHSLAGAAAGLGALSTAHASAGPLVGAISSVTPGQVLFTQSAPGGGSGGATGTSSSVMDNNTPLPTGTVGQELIPSAPEPGPALAMGIGALLLAGLGLRRRLS